MRAVIQRVASAEVRVGPRITGSIGKGLLILVGVADDDEHYDAEWLAHKALGLRLFDDSHGVMNLSAVELSDVGVLVVSQFTLLASTKKGQRPSYHLAARPGKAVPFYESFITHCRQILARPVETGEFGADMQVALVNDGPVTILLDSKVRE
jgi:D-tyrosyl-tRNA(Tyr) deacylase